MSSNALDPAAILTTIPTLLPEGDKQLGHPQDAIAAFLHAVMSILGFRLVGLDDSSSDVAYEKNLLPAEWKKTSPELYAFRYKHEQSSLVFFLKIVKLSKRLVIHGIALGVRFQILPCRPQFPSINWIYLQDDKTTTLDIVIEDFTSASFYPYNGATNTSPLVHGFISSARVNDLVGQYKIQILQRLLPSLRKAGYEEESVAVTTSSTSAYASSSAPAPLPFRPSPPSIPPNPDNTGQPFALPRPNYGPNNPLEIGRSDLEPLGGRNPFAPPPLFPGGSGDDGMFLGPSQFFRDRMEPRWGGDGFLPPMGAPPGARFDPVGPFEPPRAGGGYRFPGSAGGGGGGRGRGFGPGGGGGATGPDNDEFMPPGAVRWIHFPQTLAFDWRIDTNFSFISPLCRAICTARGHLQSALFSFLLS
jgi:proteasome inhibitor subunit 1 (PI31)